MYAFDYQRPSALAEAAKLFGDGEDASYIAGAVIPVDGGMGMGH